MIDLFLLRYNPPGVIRSCLVFQCQYHSAVDQQIYNAAGIHLYRQRGNVDNASVVQQQSINVSRYREAIDIAAMYNEVAMEIKRIAKWVQRTQFI